MKYIGKILEYNGKYGTIATENDIIEFAKKNISFNQEILVEDIVEFRLEHRFPNIKIAKNINKLIK